MKIHIGTIVGTGKPLYLDLEKLKHLLLQASSGGGKSNALRVILEQAHGKFPQYVVDVEGELSSLRDGGDYVLVADQNGDVKADTQTAALLARRCADANFDVIVDLSEVQRHDQHKYVMLAQQTFTNLPRDLWGPRLIVIDEANLFAPESGKQKDGSVAKDATVDTAARGRKRDHKGLFAMTRLAKFSKDVAAECQDKLIGLANLADDRKRAVEELGVTGEQRKDVEARLAHLKPGQFYAVGPAFGLAEVTLVQVFLAKTQPPPKGKAARKAPAPRASIERILKQIGDLPAQAAEEARNMADAKARIRDLEAQVRKLQAGVPTASPRVEQVVERIEVSTLTEKDWKRIEAIEEKRIEAAGQVADVLREAHRAVGTFLQQVLAENPGLKAAVDQAIADRNAHTARTMRAAQAAAFAHRVANSKDPAPLLAGASSQVGARKVRATMAQGGPSEALPKGEKAVLNACAEYAEGADRSQLTVLTGYKRSSRDAFISRLAGKGYVEQVGDRIVATDAGVAALGDDFKPLPKGQALQEYWLQRLPEGERRIFEILLQAPGPVDRASLDEQTGYMRSSRDAFLSRLAAKKLVEQVGRGQVAANRMLFQEQ